MPPSQTLNVLITLPTILLISATIIFLVAERVFPGRPLPHSAGWYLRCLSIEGFIGWFIGTFVFYWWHRLRHQNRFWQVFHQIHHSASRIEVLTSFYKHPVEILVNSFLAAIILFPLLGASLMASFWYNFFAATGEYFYHANLKSPNWIRYFIQTPELHSVHQYLQGLHIIYAKMWIS
ncbi:MAG: sterol desaturase family protein [Planctomycetota bacterium]